VYPPMCLLRRGIEVPLEDREHHLHSYYYNVSFALRCNIKVFSGVYNKSPKFERIANDLETSEKVILE
jgi:hypothetical protein